MVFGREGISSAKAFIVLFSVNPGEAAIHSRTVAVV